MTPVSPEEDFVEITSFRRFPGFFAVSIQYNHLVANCVILHNVSQMSRILHELVQEGHTITPEAISGTSPFMHEHIIRLGQYSLELNRQPPAIQYQLPIITPQDFPDLARHWRLSCMLLTSPTAI